MKKVEKYFQPYFVTYLVLFYVSREISILTNKASLSVLFLPPVSIPKEKNFLLSVQESKRQSHKLSPFEKWMAGNQPSGSIPLNYLIHGMYFTGLMPDSRRSLSEGQLIFRNLTRGDAQVIQCNASNIHGYLWKDVALSILGR